MTEARLAIAYVCDNFPALSQTFVQNELRELHSLGVHPRVFTLYPPKSLDTTAGDLAHHRLDSATSHPLRFGRALGRVARRRPRGLARAVALTAARPSRLQLHAFAKSVFLLDAVGDERFDRLHAHFAKMSASTAMLAAAALGARFSFTAHANDLFQWPFDVARKLRRADVTVTVCDYNRRRMRETWGDVGSIAIVPCGVQVDRFRRATPYRRDPFTIVAVSRLVEKKGFDDLVRACALLRDGGVAFRCRIVGDGPERAHLEALIAEHDLDPVVAIEGAATPDMVRDALESASVFCLPCVIASDGDLDSQPVVIKEAMAMEVPVVVTDEVANPEIVDDEVGRLVPPRRPVALAAALAELAAADEGALRAMGRAGRERVERDLDLGRLAARLVETWAAAAGELPIPATGSG